MSDHLLLHLAESRLLANARFAADLLHIVDRGQLKLRILYFHLTLRQFGIVRSSHKICQLNGLCVLCAEIYVQTVDTHHKQTGVEAQELFVLQLHGNNRILLLLVVLCQFLGILFFMKQEYLIIVALRFTIYIRHLGAYTHDHINLRCFLKLFQKCLLFIRLHGYSVLSKVNRYGR